MRVLVMAADPAALITGLRVLGPLAHWNREGSAEVVALGYHAVEAADLAAADVVIAQRPVVERHLQLIRRARQGPAAVVVELDDLLSDPPDHLLHSATMRAHGLNLRQALWLADAVSVSTGRLRAALELSDERSVIVPNCAAEASTEADRAALDPAWLPAGPTVLLAASDRLWPGQLLAALRRLQAAQGVQLLAVGPAAEGLADAGLVVQVLPSLRRPQFMALAAALPQAVGAIPLDASRFSACKSAVKWMDWARAGLPVVAQDLPPYADAIRDGQTGALVADDAEAWLRALERALFDQTWRQRVRAAAAAEVAGQHTLAHTAAAWDRALRLALSRRAARPADPRPPSAAWRAWWGAQACRLRRWNRERLARRHRV